MSEPLPFGSATPRFALPLLFAGQAQKEFFVNEALLRTDVLLHCVIEEQLTSPPASPRSGQAWLVAAPATETFVGHEHEIAAWTEGGWRFVAPIPGMRVFDRSLGAFRLFLSNSWREPGVLSAPTGGSTVDLEARATLTELLNMLVKSGVLQAS